MPPALVPPQILLEDGPLLAVNKPAGWLTQGDAGNAPSLEVWVKDLLKVRHGKPGNVYLGIPHRLDRQVSGVVVFARNSKAASRLAEQFRERTVRKVYWALVSGRVEPNRGVLTDWLTKDAAAGMVEVVAPGDVRARESRLEYRVLAVQDEATLVEVVPLTGRTHQIRVQLAHRGWPILGDRKYGSTVDWIPGEGDEPMAIGLHARSLTLRHPVRYGELTVESPPPDPMASWLP